MSKLADLMRKRAEEAGIEFQDEYLQRLSEDERINGYIKVNIPRYGKEGLGGEGCWVWINPQDKEKYADDNFFGKINGILDNETVYAYPGVLLPGMVITMKCNGDKRPTLDPEWIQEKLIKTGLYKEEQG